MSFVQQAKDKLRAQYEKSKNKINTRVAEYEREREPSVVKARIQEERAKIKNSIKQEQARADFERDKKTLSDLRRSNSTLGKFGSAVKEHLQNVKQSQKPRQVKQLNKSSGIGFGGGRNIIYDNEKSTSSVFGHAGGVMGARAPVKKVEKKPQTIVIKLER